MERQRLRAIRYGVPVGAHGPDIVGGQGIHTSEGAAIRSGGGVDVTRSTLDGNVAADTGGAVFAFDVPVRFAEDKLDTAGASFAAGEAPSVPVVEVREAA